MQEVVTQLDRALNGLLSHRGVVGGAPSFCTVCEEFDGHLRDCPVVDIIRARNHVQNTRDFYQNAWKTAVEEFGELYRMIMADKIAEAKEWCEARTMKLTEGDILPVDMEALDKDRRF